MKAISENNLWDPVKSILWLAGKFIVIFAAVYFIWHVTSPIGTKIYAEVGGGFVKLFDRAGYTLSVTTFENYMIFDYKYKKNNKPLTLEYKGFTFNSVFLISLILVVPNINYKLRLKILLLGLLIIFPEQIFRLVIFVFNYYTQNMKRKSGDFIYPAYIHYSLGYLDRILIRVDGQIIPVMIWASLFYYYKWHYAIKKMRMRVNSES